MDAQVFDSRDLDLTPQARAARATYLLMTHGRMSTSELIRELGYTQSNSVMFLMDSISSTLPVMRNDGYWEIVEE